jgi:hypothetical protein
MHGQAIEESVGREDLLGEDACAVAAAPTAVACA